MSSDKFNAGLTLQWTRMPFRDEKNYIVIIVIMYLNSHFM